MKDHELQTIEQLTGVSPDQIKLTDDGFWSRGNHYSSMLEYKCGQTAHGTQERY